MSRAQSRYSKSQIQQIDAPLMKINQLINSIFAMNQQTLKQQLYTCSKIVSQLLQNQLINHISNIGAAKLLCFQLILMVAEENAVENKPKLQLLENAFQNNKKVRLTASLRNTLTGIQQLLQQMIWKNVGKKKGGTEKNIIQSSPLYQSFMQFKHLLTDFDSQLTNEPQSPERIKNFTQKISSKKKKNEDNNSQSQQSQENEALIEQLQQIVAKKQKRIKQLNDELQQNILQQKAQEDLIVQLESRNIDLKQQIYALNSRLTEKDANQIKLYDKIGALKEQILLKQKQINSKKQNNNNNIKTQKTIKTKFSLNDQQQFSTSKKQFKDILQQKNIVCMECEAKKDISVEDIDSFRKILITQAISIEALI